MKLRESIGINAEYNIKASCKVFFCKAFEAAKSYQRELFLSILPRPLPADSILVGTVALKKLFKPTSQVLILICAHGENDQLKIPTKFICDVLCQLLALILLVDGIELASVDGAQDTDEWLGYHTYPVGD